MPGFFTEEELRRLQLMDWGNEEDLYAARPTYYEPSYYNEEAAGRGSYVEPEYVPRGYEPPPEAYIPRYEEPDTSYEDAVRASRTAWPSEDEAFGASRPEYYEPNRYNEEAAPRGFVPDPIYLYHDSAEEAAPRTYFDDDTLAEGSNPFLRMQGREAEERYRLNSRLGSINPLEAGLTMFGGIANNLDRPGAALRASLESGDPFFSLGSLRAAGEGFQNPEEYGTGDILRRAGMGDQNLWGRMPYLPDNISVRDILGGIGDAVIDPTNVLPAGRFGELAGGAAGLLGSGARRATAPAADAFGAVARRAAPAFEEPLRLARRAAADETGSLTLPGRAARAIDEPVEEVFRYPAPEAGRQLFGLDDIEPGLTRGQRAWSAFSDLAGVGTPDDPVAAPAMDLRARSQFRIQSQANRAAAEMDAVAKSAFEFGPNQRIKTLPGNPTIQDVAARRPEYAQYLTDPQFKALDRLEAEAGLYRQFLDEVGFGENLGVRPDIMPGGFYLPRGNAMKEGSEVPYKVRAGRGGGKAGFEQTAELESMAAGLDAGYVYTPFRDALNGTFEAMGRKGVDTHIANYLRQYGDTMAEGLGRESGQIGVPLATAGMQFPDRLANAVNKQLRRQGEMQGMGTELPLAIRSFNRMLTFSGATGEMSNMGIQGITGAFADFPAFATAVKASLKAWGPGGDGVLGDYLKMATERSLAEPPNKFGQRPPTPAEWAARKGGQFGGAETEFSMGRGVGGKIGEAIKNAPYIRQSNRQFGYFGDVLRNEWRDTLWHDAASKGAVPEAALDKIAEAAAKLSGYSERKAFGSWGEWLEFAPRFMQARVTGLLDTRKIVTGDKYDRMIQRNTMLKYLTLATISTVAANEIRGKDTEYNPVKNGKWNTNWMRVKDVAGRDWSLLGPYDALLRMTVMAGTGDLPGAARSLLNSPAISTGWDLISGFDFMGNATRLQSEGAKWGGLASKETAEYLAKRPLPFGSRGAGEAIGQLRDSDLARAAGSAVSAFTGLKSTLVTLNEQRDMLVAGYTSGKIKEYSKLPDGEEKFKFDTLYPEITEKISKERIARGGPFARAEQLKVDSTAEQLASDDKYQHGVIEMDAWRDDYNARQLVLREKREEVLLGIPDKDAGSLLSRYFDAIDAAEGADGKVDWDRVEAFRAGLTVGENAIIDRNTGIGGTPLVQEHRAILRGLANTGYFESYDQAWDEIKANTPEKAKDEQLANADSLGAYQNIWEARYAADLAQKGMDPRIARERAVLMFQSSPFKTAFDDINGRIKREWVKAHPDLAVGAFQHAYLTPGKANLEAYDEATATP